MLQCAYCSLHADLNSTCSASCACTDMDDVRSQVEAEKKAAAAAQEGNAKRLRDAEARVESLEETVEELRVAMDRQRAAADLRCCAPSRCCLTRPNFAYKLHAGMPALWAAQDALNTRYPPLKETQSKMTH